MQAQAAEFPGYAKSLRRLSRPFFKAFQQLGELAIKPWIKDPKSFFDKAFIKEIPLDVTLDHRIEVVLIPAQSAGCIINMNRARQVICNGIFFPHRSVAAEGARCVPELSG